MKQTILDLGDKLRTMLGDGTADLSEEFIIGAYNHAISELPLVPRLDKLFTKHKQFNLDAKDHYRWSLSDATGFRKISDIPMLNFYTSTGGDPCPLRLCQRAVREFYDHNGLVNLKQAGTPCEYTLEVEDDNVWLVLDRPSNVPIIVDYIAYGFPKPVQNMDDEVDVSVIAERLILGVMQAYYLHEADDWSFADNVENFLDNKLYLEAIQMLHKNWGSNGPRVLGEVE